MSQLLSSTRPLATVLSAGPCVRALVSLVALFLGSDRASAQTPAAASERRGTGLAQESTDEIICRFRREWTAEKNQIRSLDERKWKASSKVLKGLIQIGPEAVPSLVRGLDDENVEARVFAAQALGFVGDARAVNRLERTLAEDKDPAARLYAADSLGIIGGFRLNPLVERIAVKNPNKDVRAHLTYAIERNGEAISKTVRDDLGRFDLTRLAAAEVGKSAPDFTLTDALGRRYQLSDFHGKKPVVLVFIYGET
ncbi:MAG: HEAT repeat domain-containing protein [Isosphaeraceae bacterium]